MEINNLPFFSPGLLLDLINTEMPFGQYKGLKICDLPGHYVEWFARTGFPAGKIGDLLALIYEIDLNGLRRLLEPLKEERKGLLS